MVFFNTDKIRKITMQNGNDGNSEDLYEFIISDYFTVSYVCFKYITISKPYEKE